jgi:uncharacterized protein (DUF58 family)
MTRRPTTKAGVVASVGALLVVVGTTAQAGWLFVLAAGVLGLVASGVLTPHRLAAATVIRVVPQRARVGETVPVRLSVHNSSTRRLPVLRVEDRHPAFEQTATACESLAAGATATLEVQRMAVRRGVFDTGEVALETAAPFGLVRSRKSAEAASRVIVHPVLTDVSSVPLPETPATSDDDSVNVARSGHGEVFAGVRDYRPGDQRRWIHWRTTARTGRLAVREHEEPARSPVVLVVTGLDGSHDDEHVASAAASIGLEALAQDRPVHCVGAGRFGEVVENATALGVLDWAAALGPSKTQPHEAVAAALRRWGRRCALILLETKEGRADGAAADALRRGVAVQVVVARCPGHEEEAG